MDRGDLARASKDFEELLAHRPARSDFHYMRGLAHKYMCDWRTSLDHNLRAIELEDEFDQAQHWNAAIAATALGEWQVARDLWAACGINIPEGDGPVDGDFGVAVVRLNPWRGGETVFARRIDPVRARLLNVPLPESGHRFGDIVLHDGAKTGSRRDGNGREVAVFNELERLIPSQFRTFVAFVECAGPEDLEALVGATGPGIGYSEDWTSGIAHYCLRCSYGAPHRHDAQQPTGEWESSRGVGIAAQSRLAVEKLLADWAAATPGRAIEAIESRESDVPEREDGHVWWRGPEDASE